MTTLVPKRTSTRRGNPCTSLIAWKPFEIELIKHDIIPPFRTRKAAYGKRSKLGIGSRSRMRECMPDDIDMITLEKHCNISATEMFRHLVSIAQNVDLDCIPQDVQKPSTPQISFFKDRPCDKPRHPRGDKTIAILSLYNAGMDAHTIANKVDIPKSLVEDILVQANTIDKNF